MSSPFGTAEIRREFPPEYDPPAFVSQHRSCGVARRLALRADATCCCPLGWAVARGGTTLYVGCAPMGSRSTMVEREKRRSWWQRPGPWRGAPKSPAKTITITTTTTTTTGNCLGTSAPKH
jgi:hypothetical protein